MRISLLTVMLAGAAMEGARARSCTGPLAQLSYATYEGTALENGVNQFLGMRYAESPVGENRFRKPKSPRTETGLQQAKEVLTTRKGTTYVGEAADMVVLIAWSGLRGRYGACVSCS
jgi:hypothetical protein